MRHDAHGYNTGLRMKIRLCIWGMAIAAVLAGQSPDGRPLQPKVEDGAYSRWLAKPVLQSRLLDNMEDLAEWSFAGTGEMTLTSERFKDGKSALRMHTGSTVAVAGGDAEWADMVATRRVASENWAEFNRISVWVYADVVGAPAISFSITLHNDGKHKLPDRYNEGRHESIILENHAWNHVVWEITPLDRDKVTGLDFAYSLPKKLPDLGDNTILDLDQLELQQVDADHVEGWDVAAGRIALSYSGYGTGAPKSAIASGLTAAEFSVLRTGTESVVLTKAVSTQKTSLGQYQVMDFSEIHQPGDYVIRAGSLTTPPFHIGDDAWRSSILKALNFLYTERCGMEIPGIHGRCHQDCYGVHGDKRIIVNGGYHDAGDLTATGNTVDIVYALLSLADRLQKQGIDPELSKRVIDESKWGLAWVLKTRFGDGFRTTGQLISYWTNGIMGDADDRFGNATNDPAWNLRVSAAEALAARVLKNSDPELAARSLRIAEDDWRFAIEGLKTAKPIKAVYGSPDELERASLGAIASTDLYIATGKQLYADKAFEFGNSVLASQERTIQPWSQAITGFFYTGPDRQHIFHRFHKGEEQGPLVALVHLCETFPSDSRWMEWYSALVLYSDYYVKKVAAMGQPFAMLPAGIYKEGEEDSIKGEEGWTPLRAADRDSFLAQIKMGVALGEKAYLRRFPVWFDFRGNFSVLLSQAKALAAAAQFRNDLASLDLAQQQAEWVAGRNPFAASTMYGEGYDWEPLYSVRSGQIVGALPVGIETREFNDAPYWPHQICWTYKEVWTHPVGRWLWLMQDMAGPAVVEGRAAPGGSDFVQFRQSTTGETVPVPVDPSTGSFHAVLPQGEYAVTQGDVSQTMTLLPAGRYQLNLQPEHAVSFTVVGQPSLSGDRELRLSVKGAGRHIFELRSANLVVAGQQRQTVDLFPGRAASLVWHVRIDKQDTPWVVVMVPDGDLGQKVELTGTSK
jgi:Glycosyl hydrolase family 9/Cellulase N-terminal ig-like domain